ncbi:MAG: hypothetical protein ACJAV1_001535 [Paraglaciecola sp.]
MVGHFAGGYLAGSLAGGTIKQRKGVFGISVMIDFEAYAAGLNNCQQVTKRYV